VKNFHGEAAAENVIDKKAVTIGGHVVLTNSVPAIIGYLIYYFRQLLG
jgi:hypothetical protein